MDGRRASTAELVAWRARLSGWRTPRAFSRTVAAMRKSHGDHVLDQPGSVWRDAYAARACAEAFEADRVRLGDDPPDFELAFGDRVEVYEFVEVLAPGRRRGDELKADRLKASEERGLPVHVPQDEWTPAPAVLTQVSRAIAGKVEKAYPPTTILVVYLNVWPVAGHQALLKGLAAAVAPACMVFKEVWVLDDGKLRRFNVPEEGVHLDPATG